MSLDAGGATQAIPRRLAERGRRLTRLSDREARPQRPLRRRCRAVSQVVPSLADGEQAASTAAKPISSIASAMFAGGCRLGRRGALNRAGRRTRPPRHAKKQSAISGVTVAFAGVAGTSPLLDESVQMDEARHRRSHSSTLMLRPRDQQYLPPCQSRHDVASAPPRQGRSALRSEPQLRVSVQSATETLRFSFAPESRSEGRPTRSRRECCCFVEAGLLKARSRSPGPSAFGGGCRAKARRARRLHHDFGLQPCAGSGVSPTAHAIAGFIQWLWSLSRLWIAAWNRHSERAGALPRRWNRRKPRSNMFCAKTGSTVAFRCL
jgi:hypothetical protein